MADKKVRRIYKEIIADLTPHIVGGFISTDDHGDYFAEVGMDAMVISVAGITMIICSDAEVIIELSGYYGEIHEVIWTDYYWPLIKDRIIEKIKVLDDILLLTKEILDDIKGFCGPNAENILTIDISAENKHVIINTHNSTIRTGLTPISFRICQRRKKDYNSIKSFKEWGKQRDNIIKHVKAILMIEILDK